MINSRRISVVLPAYNAETTLSCTVAELDACLDYQLNQRELWRCEYPDSTLASPVRLPPPVHVLERHAGTPEAADALLG
jgi:hypothetical protein